MRLKLDLDELQKVVKRTIEEERESNALKSEINRVFGTTIITEGKLETVVASANDWLDVLERTGRSSRLVFESSVTTNFLDHKNPEVRKFAARICPENYLPKVMNDKNPEVRAAVAARLQLPAVREMMKKFPHDDQIRTIFKAKKRLFESGIAKPEVKPLGIDPVAGKKRLGAVVKQDPGTELSDNWYHQKAIIFLRDYGGNIEYAWEEIAVHRFCSSLKATYGIEIDEKKLLKNIKELIKVKEDNALERNALKETLTWLETQECLNENVLPELHEELDQMYDLLKSNLTGEEYISHASKLLCVQESMLPMGIRKYRLGEGNAKQTLIPCIGMLPHKQGFRSIDERVLDTFCEYWTKRQQLAGEPLKLEWSNHPSDVNKISFTCVLK